LTKTWCGLRKKKSGQRGEVFIPSQSCVRDHCLFQEEWC
jgi:hypothetical protein